MRWQLQLQQGRLIVNILSKEFSQVLQIQRDTFQNIVLKMLNMGLMRNFRLEMN